MSQHPNGLRELGVDVGIPSSVRPRYLREAVESVLAQTYGRWRLMISEDGERSDEVEDALRDCMSDPRIAHGATGTKVGAARNMTGLLETGELRYVALLHDDDLWRPEFLARRVEFLESHPECGFVFSPAILIDQHGAEIERLRPKLREGVHEPRALVPALLRENIVPVTSIVVRRSAYKAVGAEFYERLRRIYDYEMWLRLAISFPAGYLIAWDSCWRLHGQQSSASLRDRPEEYETFLERADQLLAELRPELRLSDLQRRRRLASWLLTSALDALDQRDRRTCFALVSRSLSAHRRALLDARMLAIACGTLLGRPGRWGVRRIRDVVRRHGVNIHRASR